MKTNVVAVFSAFAITVIAAAYFWARLTSVEAPVALNSGDLVVHLIRSETTLPAFDDENGATVQIGLVARDGEEVSIIEVTDKVTQTSLNEFVKGGRNKSFQAYRLPALTAEQAQQAIAFARSHLDKPSDYFLSPQSDQLYPSELVFLAFRSAGLELGRTVKLAKIQKDMTRVRSLFNGKWQAHTPCTKRGYDWEQCWNKVSKYEVITPAAILADVRVNKIFDTNAPPVLDPHQSDHAVAAGSSEPVLRLAPQS